MKSVPHIFRTNSKSPECIAARTFAGQRDRVLRVLSAENGNFPPCCRTSTETRHHFPPGPDFSRFYRNGKRVRGIIPLIL
jgi:hypothetical protein